MTHLKRFIKIIVRRLISIGQLTSSELIINLRKQGVIIGENVNFRYPHHTLIDTTRPSLVELGNNLDINDYFTILTHDFGTYVFRNLYHDFVPSSGKVKIGSNIVFGRNVTILKGVTIGNNCIIGIGSLVTKNIPANSVVAGVPAKVICTIEEYYEKRKKECISEALVYGKSISERFNREPQIDDFHEEWTLFLNEQDYNKYPQIQRDVNFRLQNIRKSFFKRKHIFESFEDFKNAINNYNENK